MSTIDYVDHLRIDGISRPRIQEYITHEEMERLLAVVMMNRIVLDTLKTVH